MKLFCKIFTCYFFLINFPTPAMYVISHQAPAIFDEPISIYQEALQEIEVNSLTPKAQSFLELLRKHKIESKVNEKNKVLGELLKLTITKEILTELFDLIHEKFESQEQFLTEIYNEKIFTIISVAQNDPQAKKEKIFELLFRIYSKKDDIFIYQLHLLSKAYHYELCALVEKNFGSDDPYTSFRLGFDDRFYDERYKEIIDLAKKNDYPLVTFSAEWALTMKNFYENHPSWKAYTTLIEKDASLEIIKFSNAQKDFSRSEEYLIKDSIEHWLWPLLWRPNLENTITPDTYKDEIFLLLFHNIDFECFFERISEKIIAIKKFVNKYYSTSNRLENYNFSQSLDEAAAPINPGVRFFLSVKDFEDSISTLELSWDEVIQQINWVAPFFTFHSRITSKEQNNFLASEGLENNSISLVDYMDVLSKCILTDDQALTEEQRLLLEQGKIICPQPPVVQFYLKNDLRKFQEYFKGFIKPQQIRYLSEIFRAIWLEDAFLRYSFGLPMHYLYASITQINDKLFKEGLHKELTASIEIANTIFPLIDGIEQAKLELAGQEIIIFCDELRSIIKNKAVDMEIDSITKYKKLIENYYPFLKYSLEQHQQNFIQRRQRLIKYISIIDNNIAESKKALSNKSSQE